MAARPVQASMVAAALAAATVACFLVAPAAALAHGGSGQDYRSKIRSLEPASVPVEFEIEGGDDELRVENVGDEELVIYGYDQKTADNPDGWDDQYVRIGPDGVFVNLNSAAHYQNKGRYGAPVPEGRGQPNQKPDWKLVRKTPRFYSFHDHRIHWMAKTPPGSVDEQSPKEQKVTDWEVPFRYGETEGMVEGRLSYIGGEDPTMGRIEMGLSAAAVLAMLVVFGLDWRRRRRARVADVDDPGSAGPAGG